MNIFPSAFFSMFSQGEAFTKAGIPVLRVVSIDLLVMCLSNIWLNGIIGTGKTKMSLFIEVVAITLYLCYSWLFIKIHFVSLAFAWTTEFVYWGTIFFLARLYLKKGNWYSK
jgi:Na+-driven multidrug efflux pump